MATSTWDASSRSHSGSWRIRHRAPARGWAKLKSADQQQRQQQESSGSSQGPHSVPIAEGQDTQLLQAQGPAGQRQPSRSCRPRLGAARLISAAGPPGAKEQYRPEQPLVCRYQARAGRNPAGRGAAQEAALPLSQRKAPSRGDGLRNGSSAGAAAVSPKATPRLGTHARISQVPPLPVYQERRSSGKTQLCAP